MLIEKKKITLVKEKGVINNNLSQGNFPHSPYIKISTSQTKKFHQNEAVSLQFPIHRPELLPGPQTFPPSPLLSSSSASSPTPPASPNQSSSVLPDFQKLLPDKQKSLIF